MMLASRVESREDLKVCQKDPELFERETATSDLVQYYYIVIIVIIIVNIHCKIYIKIKFHFCGGNYLGKLKMFLTVLYKEYSGVNVPTPFLHQNHEGKLQHDRPRILRMALSLCVCKKKLWNLCY